MRRDMMPKFEIPHWIASIAPHNAIIARPPISSSSPHVECNRRIRMTETATLYCSSPPHIAISSHAQRSQVHSLIRNVHAELIFRAKTRHDGLDGVRDGQIDAVLFDEESLCRFRGSRSGGVRRRSHVDRWTDEGGCHQDDRKRRRRNEFWKKFRNGEIQIRASETRCACAILTVPYLPVRRVQNTFGRAIFTPSPTLKFRTLPLPPNSSTTCAQKKKVREYVAEKRRETSRSKLSSGRDRTGGAHR